ncbi:hypothetical protein WI23_02700 [Burkholderia oklahomensis C6786]|nr:hypothetical protein WI23_02700 [Burkholderia oklahomensis C6786]KUY65269.1 hypothetical protein WI23_04270 [Burkholderia oklahomensis C6786]
MVAGCATTYTVDDGRKLDDALTTQVRNYVVGEQALRPAVNASAALHDPDCSKTWEVPFEAATSYGESDSNMRVALVRVAGIDEHLRVIATTPGFPIQPGAIISELDGYKSDNAMKMIRELSELREDGKPFNLKTAAGESVTVTPVQACRGHLSLFNPGKHGNDQYYHWDVVLFPDEVGAVNLTPAEAEWIVLWTQGLSEEGGGRMKTYSYTVEAAKMLAGSILSGATMGAGGAAGNAAAAAGASLASAFSHIAAAEAPGIIAQATAKATANAATLHGVNWVASTVFDRADKWAFERMSKLGMDPRTGLELQLRLVQAGAVHNGLLFDEHRLEQINQLVASLPENPQEPTAQNHHATADMTQAGTKDVAAASAQ